MDERGETLESTIISGFGYRTSISATMGIPSSSISLTTLYTPKNSGTTAIVTASLEVNDLYILGLVAAPEVASVGVLFDGTAITALEALPTAVIYILRKMLEYLPAS